MEIKVGDWVRYRRINRLFNHLVIGVVEYISQDSVIADTGLVLLEEILEVRHSTVSTEVNKNETA